MIAHLIANTAKLMAGCRARWESTPPKPGPRVFYANHTSHLDAMVIWSALPRDVRDRCRIVAAEDYWTSTRLRRWLAHDVFKLLLINRISISRANNPMDLILPELDAGNAVIIFPEGGRGEGGDLGAFRGGLWHIARRRPMVEFTPVWLENLNRVLPKGEFLPVPLMSAVTFGRSFNRVENVGKSQFLELAENALSQLRKGAGYG